MFSNLLGSGFWRRGVLVATLAVASVAMLTTTGDVHARRMGGGSSIGRQSSKAMMLPRSRQDMSNFHKNTAATPAATRSGAGGAAGSAATGARRGWSRWLGPLAGIAGALGLAALWSHLGLSAALAEVASLLLFMLLGGIGFFFILRRLRGKVLPAQAQGAYGQAAYAPNAYKQSTEGGAGRAAVGEGRSALRSVAGVNAGMRMPSVEGTASGWMASEGIPPDFDTLRFLQQAKTQFVHIQSIWDKGDLTQLHEYLTDDLILALTPQLAQRQGMPNHTEVVLLNAELLGIEAVAGGNLASIRFSGMLREAVDAEAAHFEEIWNLFKSAQQGWLLAGIQQISTTPAAGIP